MQVRAQGNKQTKIAARSLAMTFIINNIWLQLIRYGYANSRSVKNQCGDFLFAVIIGDRFTW